MNFQDQQVIRSTDTNQLEFVMNMTMFHSKIEHETVQRRHLIQP